MWTKAVSEYMDYATVHGVGRLKNSPFIILKVIWVLCLCTSLGMIILQFILLWQKFQSNPVSTSVELKTSGQLDFPVVTICNTNPVNYMAFGEDSFLQDIVNSAADRYSINTNLFDNMSSTATYSTEPVDEDILWVTTERFRMALNRLDDESLRNISQLQDDFLLLCTYNGKRCSSESIEEVRSYEYGLCYNIYPEFQVENGTRKVSAYGKRYGIEMLVNIEDIESVPFVTQSGSVYVMVHRKNPGNRNMVLTDGAIVPAGFEADVIVSQVEKIRVSGKEAKPRCKDTGFSYLECLHDCQQKDLSAFCGCYQFLSDYAILEDEYNSTDVSSVHSCETESEYNCVQAIVASYINTVTDVCASCTVPCSEQYYEKSVSVASWPSDNFVPVIKRIVSSVKGTEFANSLNREYIRNNLVMVRVYLDSLSYESYEEEYSYSLVNFVSDLGGTLGLWAGFSALSLMEIFELLFLMCSTKKQRNRVIDVHSNEKMDNNNATN